MTARARLVAILVVATACSPKGRAGEGTGDSVAVATPAGAATDPKAGEIRDTTRRADSGATKAPPVPPKVAPTMGRDSAFGPKFGVDSTGKITPLPPKKP